jgi:hypothetical protein
MLHLHLSLDCSRGCRERTRSGLWLHYFLVYLKYFEMKNFKEKAIEDWEQDAIVCTKKNVCAYLEEGDRMSGDKDGRLT